MNDLNISFSSYVTQNSPTRGVYILNLKYYIHVAKYTLCDV